eukprot:CAMPEP_0197694542 /NCGR_PEP_ID=MMETSP1338-20131121/113969_1 /TAXON_ID=43686 ORGANISM="Pelagodinium beii, Strain RCC1491" /NCGR_SAMPLE_ID=MMETSP1338 /ASSEMBLY_ACC=CAM_ASM_000754 /LENGTH=221 /DNA_ID=CAMNT_0043277393 /DNA_START=714 /DNA_END=1380 /DNA_ORIENTATION=+
MEVPPFPSSSCTGRQTLNFEVPVEVSRLQAVVEGSAERQFLEAFWQRYPFHALVVLHPESQTFKTIRKPHAHKTLIEEHPERQRLKTAWEHDLLQAVVEFFPEVDVLKPIRQLNVMHFLVEGFSEGKICQAAWKENLLKALIVELAKGQAPKTPRQEDVFQADVEGWSEFQDFDLSWENINLGSEFRAMRLTITFMISALWLLSACGSIGVVFGLRVAGFR